MLRSTTLLILASVAPAIANAADVNECINTYIVKNWSSKSNPLITTERLNQEYAYIPVENDVAPCQRLGYTWTLQPGNIACSSGVDPAREDVEYSSRSIYDVACGASRAFWLEDRTYSMTLNIENRTDPSQSVTQVLGRDIYITSEIPRLETCFASLTVPTSEQRFITGSTQLYTFKLSYDPVACSGFGFEPALVPPNNRFTSICASSTLSSKTSSISTVCGRSPVGQLQTGQYQIELSLRTAKHNYRSKLSPAFSIVVAPADAGASPKARRRRLDIDAGNIIPDLDCELKGMATCAVGGRQGLWECVDVMSNLESCGGCVGQGAVDCSGIQGVDGASCVEGKCQVLSCLDDYELVNNGTQCEFKL